MSQEHGFYLAPTAMIDSDHRTIRDYARERAGQSRDPVERAVKLYLSVRDEIRYDPYTPFYLPDHYRASSVLKRGRGFCVPKASLLCALGRACAIPSRVGFADRSESSCHETAHRFHREVIFLSITALSNSIWKGNG